MCKNTVDINDFQSCVEDLIQQAEEKSIFDVDEIFGKSNSYYSKSSSPRRYKNPILNKPIEKPPPPITRPHKGVILRLKKSEKKIIVDDYEEENESRIPPPPPVEPPPYGILFLFLVQEVVDSLTVEPKTFQMVPPSRKTIARDLLKTNVDEVYYKRNKKPFVNSSQLEIYKS